MIYKTRQDKICSSNSIACLCLLKGDLKKIQTLSLEKNTNFLNYRKENVFTKSVSSGPSRAESHSAFLFVLLEKLAMIA